MFDEDPTRTVLLTVSTMDGYFAPFHEASPHLAVSITDHTGASFLSPNNGCSMVEVLSTLTSLVAASATQTWRVDAGMCPRFQTNHPNHKRGMKDRGMCAALVATAAILGILRLMSLSARENALLGSLAKQVSVGRHGVLRLAQLGVCVTS